MDEVKFPITRGTPLRQIVDSFIRCLVQKGYSKNAIEGELYWIMEERRRGRLISKTQRKKEDFNI